MTLKTNKTGSSFLGLFLAVACLVIFSACKNEKPEQPQEPSLEVSVTEIQVEQAASQTTIDITTDEIWEASCSQSWCTVAPNKGKGSATVTISVQANNDYTQPREAMIEVKTQTLTKTVTLTQQLRIDKRKRDSLALREIYLLLPFPTPNAAWDPEKPIDTWVGTKTELIEGELRVTGFNLNDMIYAWDGAPFEYGSTLKPSIGDMDEMRSLNLSYGHIYGPIPKEIGKMTKLQIFKAEENCFEGELPSTMANLTMMKVMVLQHNYFSGDLPEFIGNWTDLEQLNISHNNFANIPDMFGKLEKLTFFDMSVQCGFDEANGMMPVYPSEKTFPKSLTKLKNLTTIQMNNVNMVGQLPENIGEMQGLSTFSLNENKLTGSIPSSIGELKALRTLDLSKNQLTGSIPQSIGQCAQLHYCTLAENQLSGSIPEQLGECSELRSLMVDRNKFTGTLSPSLFKPKMINEMSFSYNELEGAIPQEIGTLTYLNQFDAEYNRFTSIPATINTLGTLEQLLLNGNQLTSLPQIESVTKMQRLDYLDLRDNNIEGLVPGYLGELLKIKVLLLSGNRFKGDIPVNLLNHRNAEGFFFQQNICPQQTNYGFDNCPNDGWGDPGVGEGGILG